MKIKKAVFVFFVSIVATAALLSMTGRVISAQGSGAADPTVLAKLNELSDNQKSIMKDLAAIKEDLNIIKIRVTQAQ